MCLLSCGFLLSVSFVFGGSQQRIYCPFCLLPDLGGSPGEEFHKVFSYWGEILIDKSQIEKVDTFQTFGNFLS